MNTIIAKKYLCFDALLEMIVADTSLPFCFSQDYFAELFGITIPAGEQTTIKNVKYSENIKEWGTNICVNDINDFFEKKSIPLHLSFIRSNYLNEMTFEDMIKSKSSNAYIVFAFCYGILYDESLNKDIGHVSLLEEVDEKSDMIKTYDPGPRNPGSKKVKIDDMLYAMRRRGGMYVFERTII